MGRGDVVTLGGQANCGGHAAPPVLSESDHGAMVGAVDLFLQQYGESTISQLAAAADVSEDAMLAYFEASDHLVWNTGFLVRLAADKEARVRER